MTSVGCAVWRLELQSHTDTHLFHHSKVSCLVDWLFHSFSRSSSMWWGSICSPGQTPVTLVVVNTFFTVKSKIFTNRSIRICILGVQFLLYDTLFTRLLCCVWQQQLNRLCSCDKQGFGSEKTFFFLLFVPTCSKELSICWMIWVQNTKSVRSMNIWWSCVCILCN